MFVESGADGFHFLRREGEGLTRKVVCLVLLRAGFWDHGVATGQAPLEADLSWGLVILLGELQDKRVSCTLKLAAFLVFDAHSADRRICYWHDLL